MIKSIIEYGSKEGINKIVPIYTKELIFDTKVREYCIENKCGKYGQNFMCPPIVGRVEDMKKEILTHKEGLLIFYEVYAQDVKKEHFIKKSAIEFHKVMLKLEKIANLVGNTITRAYIAGNCRLCFPCKIKIGYEHCPYPEKSRTSMEAAGINVIETCSNLGIDVKFGNNKVIWIGFLSI
ncbi:DUF2284 domain-containing protein [Clostridiisalibacter paucivorans]|uniref:DUF2284 domain-containing protein n=1 Tax=Clostridiisalibacter paucivorans TaxID=408753 RepID=UPI0004792480|nr:DUF2284 domain-containing protein [Clostridiisalibacter paucivorans]